jgi:hypothetical protein
VPQHKWFYHRLLLDDLSRKHPDVPCPAQVASAIDKSRRKRREEDPGLLTGAAGIALALPAAITPVEPAWDRMLLVSIPNGSSKG